MKLIARDQTRRAFAMDRSVPEDERGSIIIVHAAVPLVARTQIAAAINEQGLFNGLPFAGLAAATCGHGHLHPSV